MKKDWIVNSKMTFKVLIFDLDDTLYPWESYVVGAFRAIAKKWTDSFQMSEDLIFNELYSLWKISHIDVLNRFLMGKTTTIKKYLAEGVSIYRNYPLEIKLYEDAKKILERYSDFPIYIVTDGNKVVQKRKFQALGLERMVKKCLCTNAYGKQHAKPSPYCFFKIAQAEKVFPNELVYIGDNPHKDFVGLKPFGIHTIRLLRGIYRSVFLDIAYEAEKTIHHFDELDLIR